MYYEGDYIDISCFPQHVLVGASISSGATALRKLCLPDGTWSGPDLLHCYSECQSYIPAMNSSYKSIFVTVSIFTT